MELNILADSQLSTFAKLIYGNISALSIKKGYCYASNQYLAELYGKSERTITRAVSKLKKLGYIRVEHPDRRSRRIYTSPESLIDKTVSQPQVDRQNGARLIDKNDYLYINNIKNINTPLPPQGELLAKPNSIGAKPTPRSLGTNPRASGTNPRKYRSSPTRSSPRRYPPSISYNPSSHKEFDVDKPIESHEHAMRAIEKDHGKPSGRYGHDIEELQHKETTNVEDYINLCRKITKGL